jgi:hypothetical protein
MVYRKDRVVWGAVLFRTTNPEVVEGAIVRRSDRLHWTSEAAKEEVLGWIRELPQTNPSVFSRPVRLQHARVGGRFFEICALRFFAGFFWKANS